MILTIPTFSNLWGFFLVASVIALVLISLPYLLAPASFTLEKLSAYECGFAPFTNQREIFESHFIVVAILFIIFDLEIIFLLPWAATGGLGGDVFSFWSVFIFLLMLAGGLAYEWARGGLAWPIFFLFKKQRFFN